LFEYPTIRSKETTLRFAAPKFLSLCFCLFAIAATANADSPVHEVASADEVEALIEAGTLAPGDSIVWSNGVFEDVELDIEGADGTKDAPITLRAATPGGVVLRGETQFKVGAKWWIVEGFHFDGDESGVNNYNTFQFRSNGGTSAQHTCLNNCAFTNLKTDGETSKWVLMFGRDNSINRCHFSGKSSKGALLTVELGYLPEHATAGHVISGNYFADVAPQPGTDNETIRIGSSEDQNKRAACVVRDNYFLRCNGENEIVSSKSSYNVFERNTFWKCDGALVLRHGHHATVAGNFFFGDGAKNAGGIRVVDSHHKIINNYLQDLTGTSWNAAFSILGGKKPSGGNDNGYQAVNGIVVAHNSIFNCRQSILLNKSKGSRAPSGLFANNLISSSSGPLIAGDLSREDLQWQGNLMHGAATGADVDALDADPRLEKQNGLLRPGIDGPAADAAVKCGIKLATDIDGQTRPETGADVGADEVSGAIGEVVSVPLDSSAVGASFLRGDGSR
jgi:hypothetical protein